MRPIFYLFAVATFFNACQGNNENSSSDSISTEAIKNPNTAAEESADSKAQKMPEITWDKTKHNFGKVYAGQKVVHMFSFTNTGESDLILVDSRTSCGCTVPRLPEEPIKPGEKSQIQVEFDKSSEGSFSKQVTIVANTSPKEHFLHITGTVVENK